eukprot:SAG31_NODE_4923_length_2861_cov_1.583997_2_plen_161_part_00
MFAQTIFFHFCGVSADGYPLGEVDYYCGIDDPESRHTLISTEFIPEDVADGYMATESSESLTSYINTLLAASDPPTFAAIRIAPDADYGCDTACDSDCRFRRYKFDPAAVTISITVSDATPPTSTWAYLDSQGMMAYRQSTDTDTMGDKIPCASSSGWIQ